MIELLLQYLCPTLYIAKWHDNSVINMASHWETYESVHKVRWMIRGEA